MRSFLLGTGALDLAALAAAVLTVARRGGGPDDLARARVLPCFAAGLAAQAAHFAEELVSGFRVSFPGTLGLDAWPLWLFAGFNVAWLGLWLLSMPLIRRGFRFARFFAWFFALGAMANGIAHPLLALRARGYFPGLLTAPVVGILGWVLWRRLWRATEPAGRPA